MSRIKEITREQYEVMLELGLKVACETSSHWNPLFIETEAEKEFYDIHKHRRLSFYAEVEDESTFGATSTECGLE